MNCKFLLMQLKQVGNSWDRLQMAGSEAVAICKHYSSFKSISFSLNYVETIFFNIQLNKLYCNLLKTAVTFHSCNRLNVDITP